MTVNELPETRIGADDVAPQRVDMGELEHVAKWAANDAGAGTDGVESDLRDELVRECVDWQ